MLEKSFLTSVLALMCPGVNWINKLMPAVIIGPTVAIIGLSLAGNAIGDLTKRFVNSDYSVYVSLICGLVTLFTVIACSVFGKKMIKMIPFIIGILAGYVVASIFTISFFCCSSYCSFLKKMNRTLS